MKKKNFPKKLISEFPDELVENAFPHPYLEQNLRRTDDYCLRENLRFSDLKTLKAIDAIACVNFE